MSRLGAVARAMRSRLGAAMLALNTLLFVAMALHDEASRARSPLADAHAAYSRRIGLLPFLPWRARPGSA